MRAAGNSRTTVNPKSVKKLLIGANPSRTVAYSVLTVILATAVLVSTDRALLTLSKSHAADVSPAFSHLAGLVPLSLLFLLVGTLAYRRHGWLLCVLVTAFGLQVIWRPSYYRFSGDGFFSAGVGAFLRGFVETGVWFGTVVFLLGFGAWLLRTRVLPKTVRETD